MRRSKSSRMMALEADLYASSKAFWIRNGEEDGRIGRFNHILSAEQITLGVLTEPYHLSRGDDFDEAELTETGNMCGERCFPGAGWALQQYRQRIRSTGRLQLVDKHSQSESPQ